jgi:hypothetical protein
MSENFLNAVNYVHLGSTLTVTDDVRVKLNPGLPWQKLRSTRTLFTSKLDLNFT